MIWLVFALVALAAEALVLWRRAAWLPYARIALYAALAIWILAAAGPGAFVGSETGLLGWFVFGLTALLLGQVFTLVPAAARWSTPMIPLAALFFALGFDILRPDDYSYVPAAILGLMVLAVIVQAQRTFAPLNEPATPAMRIGLIIKIAAVGLLVYAAIFKVIDRGWPFPLSYMAAGGGLLFAAAQLRIGYAKLTSQPTALPWAWLSDAAVTLMVAASYCIYTPFL